jgi:hypothetical protein
MNFSGTAYLFNGTSYQRTFSGSQMGSQFGYSVAINDNFVAIGARNENNNGVSGNGAVYLFNLDGTEIGTIINPDTDANNGYFGSSLALWDGELLIGAPGNNELNNTAPGGAAYRYRISDQTLLQTFLNPTPNSGDLFGASLDYNGQYILIGSPGDDQPGANNSGAARLYNLAQEEVPEGSTVAGIIVAGASLFLLRQKK